MGCWIGKGETRFYLEGGKVFDKEGGKELSIDPETFEPAITVSSSESSPTAVVTESIGTQDEDKTEQVHAKSCKTKGRWGKFTDGCPRCEQLKRG